MMAFSHIILIKTFLLVYLKSLIMLSKKSSIALFQDKIQKNNKI